VHGREAFATTEHTRDDVVIEGVVVAVAQIQGGIPNGNGHGVAAGGIFGAENQEDAKAIQLVQGGGERLHGRGKFRELAFANAIVRYASDHGASQVRHEIASAGDSTARGR